jgi:hypothetical protein
VSKLGARKVGKSGRGGARERGGRPSPWKNGPTKTIRIPEVFAEAVLDVVKKLDSGCREIVIVDPKSLLVNQKESSCFNTAPQICPLWAQSSTSEGSNSILRELLRRRLSLNWIKT